MNSKNDGTPLIWGRVIPPTVVDMVYFGGTVIHSTADAWGGQTVRQPTAHEYTERRCAYCGRKHDPVATECAGCGAPL
jgi:hypothetical protein